MGGAGNLVDVSDSDDDLFARARLGDLRAFESLYRRHRDTARRVAGLFTTCPADADDAVAEAFSRLLAALPRLAGRQISFRSYLRAMVRNIALDRHRRMAYVDLTDDVPETRCGPDADHGALAALEGDLVRQALATLPARWRMVLWLTQVEGLSPTEVGDRFGIKPSAVAALAYRSRKGLRHAYLEADRPRPVPAAA